MTRARRTLVVTAVGGAESEERPSRFLAELAGGRRSRSSSWRRTGRQWLSLPVLTASLRRAVADAALPGRRCAGPPRPSWPGWRAAGVPGADPGSGTP